MKAMPCAKLAFPLMSLFLGSSACHDPSVSPSPDPVARVALADTPGYGPDDPPSLCSAGFAAVDVPVLATTYIQSAFSDIPACAIDGYFFADVAKDGLDDYYNNQLIPLIKRFLGCPGASQEEAPFFGLVPESHPRYTITTTDFAEIVNTFLIALSIPNQPGPGCAFGFTQPQIARMNVMLYEFAPFVINDFDPDAGLTHADPAGLNCAGGGYFGPVNIVASCNACSAVTGVFCPP
jgi:hypothetical protein